MAKPGDYAALEKYVDDVKKGKKESFGQIYDIMLPEIFRFVYFKINDRMVAEDITAETFRKALVNINNYKKDNYRAYLYEIARNTFLDTLRAQKRKSNMDISKIQDSQTDISDSIFEKERLTRALSKLSPLYNEIIVLRNIEGYSSKETAKIVKKSEGAIRVLYHRALAKLRSFLK